MSKRRAFALVELLVAIGILAVLVGLLLPAMSRAKRKSDMVKCAAQLRQLGCALDLYAQNNRGRVIPVFINPPLGWLGWPDLIYKPSEQQVLICPTADADRLSYCLNWRVVGVRITGRNSLHRPSNEILVAGENRPGFNSEYILPTPPPGEVGFDPYRHRDLGANYLWLDWHVSSEPTIPTVSNSDNGDPALVY